MSGRRGTAALVASPVLVGAVTVLIVIIAVFIAYNANSGLPFVPTYDLKAELPTGAKLVKGNEVRAGGFRVGVVEEIRPGVVTGEDGKRRAVALVDLKLDKTVEPLGTDTVVRVRPRSALGLKYLELTPGSSERAFAPGDTIPLRNASEPLELEDVFSTFKPRTRDDVRAATEGFGDAFAGRGESLNSAIEALDPLFRHLTPVMRSLADPDTELDQLFRQLGQTAAQVAPVARTQALLFSDMADTFAAITREPAALRATIEKGPSTQDVAIASFRVQRPFLADFTDLSRRLRPAARELPRSLPAINRALAVGTPVLPRSVELNERLGETFDQLDQLFENPNTLLALRDLRAGLAVARPALQFIAPFQTVCNDDVYWWTFLGTIFSQVQTGPTGGGTVLQQGIKTPNLRQPNSFGTVQSSRNWDIPPDMDPIGAEDAFGDPLMRLYNTPYPQAVDAQGNADCGVGQFGYVRGPYLAGGRYGRGLLPNGVPSGGNWPVSVDDFPITLGGTYSSRSLGIDHVKDVP